jgi:EAL domain-containing protein (putative c-di-GMP-specific phosphodiesterase class I)
MLAYCLNKKLDSQKLLQDIQDLINNNNFDPNDTLILKITLTKVSNDSTAHIKKIEYKPS